MKKEVVHNIVVLLVLIAAIGAIFMNSNLKFTGYASVSIINLSETDCVANENYTWENITDCNFIEGCTLCEPEGCVKELTGTLCTNLSCEYNCTNCTLCEPEGCVKELTGTLCTNLSCEYNCTNCQTTGRCVVYLCGNSVIDNDEECDEGQNNGQECSSDYGGLCTYCSSDCQTLTVEGAHCGDGNCDSEEDCDGCSSDCGNCEEDDDDDSSSSSSSSDSSNEDTSTSQVTTNTVKNTCTPKWNCSDWSDCVNGTKNRNCTDNNNCNSQKGVPNTSQSCELVIEETCFDRIKNQNEKGIDCGGVCEKKCSVFTIIGSVINGPIEYSKEFFQKNKLIFLITSGVVVLLIGGFITFKFLGKFKKKFNKKRSLGEGIAKKIGDITNI